MSKKIGYLAEISKQSVKGVAWFLLAPYNKMQEGRTELKEELLTKKEPELGHVANS